MVEIVSWIGVAVIALFAVVGFPGVVATSVVAVVRRCAGRHLPSPSTRATGSPPSRPQAVHPPSRG